jgi:hypothetical protein
MGRKEGESYIQWRQRVLDPISPTFCAAKNLNATIWLGSGTTSSCHHPPAHRIPLQEVLKDHRAIHSTNHPNLLTHPVERSISWANLIQRLVFSKA